MRNQGNILQRGDYVSHCLSFWDFTLQSDTVRMLDENETLKFFRAQSNPPPPSNSEHSLDSTADRSVMRTL